MFACYLCKLSAQSCSYEPLLNLTICISNWTGREYYISLKKKKKVVPCEYEGNQNNSQIWAEVSQWQDKTIEVLLSFLKYWNVSLQHFQAEAVCFIEDHLVWRLLVFFFLHFQMDLNLKGRELWFLVWLFFKRLNSLQANQNILLLVKQNVFSLPKMKRAFLIILSFLFSSAPNPEHSTTRRNQSSLFSPYCCSSKGSNFGCPYFNQSLLY